MKFKAKVDFRGAPDHINVKRYRQGRTYDEPEEFVRNHVLPNKRGILVRSSGEKATMERRSLDAAPENKGMGESEESKSVKKKATGKK